MPVVSQHPTRPEIWHLTLSNAEHARLLSLGHEAGRFIASTASETLGLGRFVALDPSDPDTEWRTSHRNSEAAFLVLADSIGFLLAPQNQGAVRSIIDQLPDLSEDETRDAFAAARA